MDNKVAFGVIKNVIIEQNKELLKIIAKQYQLDYDILVEKYITPAYYLPVVQVTDNKDNKDNKKNINK
jgi:hypothetical protein